MRATAENPQIAGLMGVNINVIISATFLIGSALAAYALTEAGSGSDSAAMRTTAHRDGDEYVINGQKIWTSGAHYSDYGLLIARTDHADALRLYATVLLGAAGEELNLTVEDGLGRTVATKYEYAGGYAFSAFIDGAGRLLWTSEINVPEAHALELAWLPGGSLYNRAHYVERGTYLDDKGNTAVVDGHGDHGGHALLARGRGAHRPAREVRSALPLRGLQFQSELHGPRRADLVEAAQASVGAARAETVG